MGLRDWLRKLGGGAGRAEVERAGARASHPAEEYGLTGEDEIDPFDPFPDGVRLAIGDIFDLHTVAPRDVRRVVEEYLLEARRAGFRSVRIIHGKGIGVQRENVRSILARTPFVESWTDAPPDAGGWGATIAHLSQPDEH